jgi:hypothetical protein
MFYFIKTSIMNTKFIQKHFIRVDMIDHSLNEAINSRDLEYIMRKK